MSRHAAPDPLPLDIRLMRLLASLLSAVLVGLVVAAIALWAVRHPVWALRGIEVHGDVTHQNEATVRAYLGPVLAGSFLTLDLFAVRQALQSMPWVREAVVQRAWPNRLRITLTEHQAAAWWGEAGGSQLVNVQGEVFEAGDTDDEADRLPELAGPKGQSATVKATFDRLSAQLAEHRMRIERLELSAQGSWRMDLDGGSHIELGRGSVEELQARLAQYLATVGQVTAGLGRKVVAADLRYPGGYAVRLHGIATLQEGQPAPKPAPAAKPARPAAKPGTNPKPTAPLATPPARVPARAAAWAQTRTA